MINFNGTGGLYRPCNCPVRPRRVAYFANRNKGSFKEPQQRLAGNKREADGIFQFALEPSITFAAAIRGLSINCSYVRRMLRYRSDTGFGEFSGAGPTSSNIPVTRKLNWAQ